MDELLREVVEGVRYDEYLRAEGLALSWVGTGRLIFSLNYTDADFAAVADRFVAAAKAWLHCDIYAWNQASKPGRPEGAECQGARALYHLLAARYG